MNGQKGTIAFEGWLTKMRKNCYDTKFLSILLLLIHEPSSLFQLIVRDIVVILSNFVNDSLGC